MEKKCYKRDNHKKNYTKYTLSSRKESSNFYIWFILEE